MRRASLFLWLPAVAVALCPAVLAQEPVQQAPEGAGQGRAPSSARPAPATGSKPAAGSESGGDKAPAPDAPEVGKPAPGDSAPGAEQPQSALTPPRLLEFVEAAYPEQAQEAGLEAVVELEITIGADGLVTDVRVVTPVGNGFDEAALEAARRFRFEPARKDGEPVPSRVRFPYVFEIREVAQPAAPTPEEPLPARFEGRVLDMDDDGPIEGVEVLVSSPDASVTRRAVTDADGRFGFDELPPGQYSVSLLAQDYGAEEGTYKLASNEETSVIFRMQLERDPYAFGATARVPPPPREVTRRTVQKVELTRVAGTRGDPLRTVEILPGVARPPFGSGALIVRGSSPRDTQTMFEGLPIQLIYHFGGLTSVINSRLLDSIDFYPGNFSVRYGRGLGGIVEVRAADPVYERIGGVADINLLDASLLVGAPLWDEGGLAIAARRSYIDFLLESAFSDDTFSLVAAPVYWDYQAIGSTRIGSRDKLRIMAFGSRDTFALLFQQPPEDSAEVTGDLDLILESHRGHVTWSRQLSDSVDQDVELAVGTAQARFGLGEIVNFELDLLQIYARSEWRCRLTRRVRLIGGLDLLSGPGDFAYKGPFMGQGEGGDDDRGPFGAQQMVDVEGPYTVFDPAAYLESDLNMDPLRVVLGLRVDYFGAIDAFSFDPRLSGRYALSEQLALKAGVGMFSQAPLEYESEELLGNPNLKPQRAMHVSAGADYEVLDGAIVGLEGFYKYLFQRVVVGQFEDFDATYLNDGIGRIYGLELSAKVEPKGRVFGYLSYTLSRSQRRDRDEPWRLFDFDQPHILTLSSTVRLGKGWELGGTFRLVSGNPDTPLDGAMYYVPYGEYGPVWGLPNSIRSRMFHRLDVRVEKLWRFQHWRLAVYLDVQNAYNATNQEGIIYDYRYNQKVVLPGLPILPILGVRGEL